MFQLVCFAAEFSRASILFYLTCHEWWNPSSELKSDAVMISYTSSERFLKSNGSIPTKIPKVL